MKLVIDEQLKHRLIGLAVIISLGAIFAPAMMKKSTQNMESNYNVRVNLPPQPTAPNVAIADEQEVFQTIKMAKVTIPDVGTESQLPELARAEELHSDLDATREIAVIQRPHIDNSNTAVDIALNSTAQNSIKHAHIATSKPVSVAARNLMAPGVKKATVIVAKAKVKQPQIAKAMNQKMSKREMYAVQLASFSKVNNAQALVNKLQARGYKAHYARVAGRNGVSFKVYAGQVPQKVAANKLRVQLASSMQLNGFVVTTGVS